MNDITEQKLDLLKEIGNIGSANAATALSKLLNRRIDMDVPSVKIVDFTEIMELAGGPDEIIVSVLLELHGDVRGSMFFFMSPEQEGRIVEELLGGQETWTEEMSQSVIKEISNILGSSYVTALSDFTNLSINISVPHLSIDMSGAVLSNGLMEIACESDFAITIDTAISGRDKNNEGIDFFFLLLPSHGSFEKIYEMFGVIKNE